ncbi:flagellar basal body-associated protein FliL [Erythrobacter sp. KY5]|uniref:flagellar basal body-associated FliL family protein n=1 Tax=Erythrobacter sp. KY5 TaxID=2011159 RepID=UPI000DBF3216|nr:flagellar basal body-associated FliL family protein [Erythrobacter sp. KY5]AWW73565.1 flagellar basal body-associated protein FliL [Erythrobacter sp. KY5]
MAGDKDEGTGKKSRGGLVKVALGAVFLLVAGAGGAYAAVASGAFGDSGPSGPDLPEFVLKGESDPYALPTSGKDDEVSIVYGDGGSEYRTAYYSFDDSFTANLADSPALIQVELAVSTRRDGRVLQWVQAHELAIRSAILGQLAATSESDIYSVEGKEALAVRLAQAVNAVLEETEGFGGVDAVHFKGILVQ